MIAFCGDGGLMMLLGDLRTAVTYRLPATFVVFNNKRLGMVKLEQEQSGLPEFGTELDNPDLAAVAAAMGLHAQQVTRPEDVAEALRTALAHDGPVSGGHSHQPRRDLGAAQAHRATGLGVRDRQDQGKPEQPGMSAINTFRHVQYPAQSR